MTESEVKAICRDHGYDPSCVYKVELLPDRIVFHTFRLNSLGNKYVIGGPEDPAMKTGDWSAFIRDLPRVGDMATRINEFVYTPEATN